MEELEEQRQIKAYLLGALAEEEQQQIEQRVFTDPSFKAKVLVVEDELVEDYVAGLLSDSERESFRSYFLSTPAQIQKLRIAKALYIYSNDDRTGNAAEQPAPPQPVPLPKNRLRALFSEWQATAILSAAALIVVIGAAVYMVVWRGDDNQRAALKQEISQLNNGLDPQTGLPPGTDPRATGIVTASLSPDLNRASAEMTRISVPAKTGIVQIRLPLAQEQRRAYQVTLSTIEGAEIFTLDAAAPLLMNGKPVLVLNIPARVLVRGDYLLKLSGAGETTTLSGADEYPFRVMR